MDCDDPTARSMMQNLCSMMAGGMCGMNSLARTSSRIASQ